MSLQLWKKITRYLEQFNWILHIFIETEDLGKSWNFMKKCQ